VIVDYHMHLRDSAGLIDHKARAVEPFVETAAARGVDEIGFTEHVYYFRQTREIWHLPYHTERCVYDLDAYCDAVVDAKRRGLPVKLGLEVDFVGERQGRLGELLAPYPWDYLLGSVHEVRDVAVDQEPGIWAELDVDAVWVGYIESLGALARSGAVDVLAHPDLAKIYGLRPTPERLAELHERLVDAVADGGVAVEISTAGLRKPVGELYPDPELLAAFVRRSVPVTLASDAHEPELVGESFGEALALARGAGCSTVAVFSGRERGLEPLG
jgi:histidinol-phosphatase (PHP family)